MSNATPEGEALYYVDLIGRLLATKQYEWARDALEGISTTMLEQRRATPKQKEAIDHIITGKLRHDAARERSA